MVLFCELKFIIIKLLQILKITVVSFLIKKWWPCYLITKNVYGSWVLFSKFWIEEVSGIMSILIVEIMAIVKALNWLEVQKYAH